MIPYLTLARYGNRKLPLDILFLGPYPPPPGGVAAHLERLASLLSANGFRIGICNHFGERGQDPLVVGTLRRNPIRYWRAVRKWRAHIVHYHHSRFSTLLAVALARPNICATALFITIHGHGLRPYLESRITARLARLAIRRFDEVIAVSEEVGVTLQRHLPDLQPVVLPAYIPVQMARSDIPASIDRFLGSPGRTLIVSAYKVAPRGNSDPYGIDFAVRTFARVSDDHSDLRLAIFLAQEPRRRRARRYLDGLLNSLAASGLRERVAIFTSMPLAAAFAYDVVYLRPTRTEGDAVSVREALHARRPVLASDIVTRPPGVTALPLSHSTAWDAAIANELTGPRRRWPAPIPRRCDEGSSADSRMPTTDLQPEALLDLYRRYLPGTARQRTTKAPAPTSSP